MGTKEILGPWLAEVMRKVRLNILWQKPVHCPGRARVCLVLSMWWLWSLISVSIISPDPIILVNFLRIGFRPLEPEFKEGKCFSSLIAVLPLTKHGFYSSRVEAQ